MMSKIQLSYKMKLRNIDKKTYKTLQYITKLSKNLYNEAIYLEICLSGVSKTK